MDSPFFCHSRCSIVEVGQLHVQMSATQSFHCADMDCLNSSPPLAHQTVHTPAVSISAAGCLVIRPGDFVSLRTERWHQLQNLKK